eukprot:14494637-Alexandrium_andersonii.AAC.1
MEHTRPDCTWRASTSRRSRRRLAALDCDRHLAYRGPRSPEVHRRTDVQPAFVEPRLLAVTTVNCQLEAAVVEAHAHPVPDGLHHGC